MKHLRFIASETHPVGSPHHQAVKEYLIAEFQRLGYEVHVQEAHSPIPMSNVLARRAGQVEGGKAVMLAAHYDSVRWGPGAGDDGAAVAGLLEVARIMSAGSYRNDVIFLISDGEEMGLWGARLFVSEHPWVNDVGAVLNFDARGTSGPSVMYETTEGNGWLIDLYARVAPHPVCSSIAYDVYKLMPNKTDFTVLREVQGLQGLNFAFINGYAFYHTAQDDVEHLDPRSLRHSGTQALRLGQALAQMDLASPPKTGDSIYFDVLSLKVIRYPIRAAPVIAIVASITAFAATALAVRQQKVSLRGTLIGLGLLVASLVLVSLTCTAAVWLLKDAKLSIYADFTIAGHLLIATVLTVGIFALEPWRIRELDLSAAGLLVWAIVTLLTGLTMRGGSYLTAWPLFSVALGFIAALYCGRRLMPLVLILSVIVPLVLISPLMYLMFLALTVRSPALPIAAVVAALWLLPMQFRFIFLGEPSGEV
jgi:hypothetical protein